ncbi:MAG TPA: adenosylcobinamide-GDP ribazoletransferase [Candidatus Limnocylindrales bacterium]|nr:adenosylcobinamide-GDP ribazoletransferase [Candidatus Limnocylindrales bacterium]
MSRPAPAAGAATTPRAARRPASALAELRAAFAFLTRLPVLPRTGRAAGDTTRTGAAAFGLVGALVGGAAAVPILLLGSRLPLPAAAFALLVVIAASGGLHLDGLADTADALAAPSPDAAERARTDPRAGAVGVTAIVLDLLLSASLLAAIEASDVGLAAAAIVVASAASRGTAPIAARIERRHPRTTGGLGGWFAERVTMLDAAAALATVIVIIAGATAAIGGLVIPIGVLAGLGVAALVGALVVARRGQLDGDGYGAIVEITFVAVLAGVAVQIR